jgi:hypothetical protein
MGSFPQLAVLFSAGIGVGSQLFYQPSLSCRSLDAWTPWNGFGQDVAALSSLSERALDGGGGNGKCLSDFGLALSLVDRSQHSLSQIL